MSERKGVVTFKGNPITLLGEEVKKGDKAKDFTVLGTDLSEVKLSDYAGKVVVISVFPSVDTGVCALQLTRFIQEAANFDKNVQLITMHLPKTIDRDVTHTDNTFGFSTALEIATDAIDQLHSTAHSHHRKIGRAHV